jgi:hypothetical protein
MAGGLGALVAVLAGPVGALPVDRLPGAVASAQSSTQSSTQTSTSGQGIVDLQAMVVHGVQPGPGLWKVSRGENVLWILGTLAPLPRDIQWRSTEVEQTIAQSQQVLMPPRVNVDADVGFFGKLALVPSAMKAMKNNDGRELQEVLPADLYARWVPLKRYYLGNDSGVEKKRPMIAAGELYQAAIKRSGLSRKPVIWPLVERTAKRAGLTPTPTTLEFKISDPKAALQEFTSGGVDDTACFRSLINAVQNDLPTMVERANAWSVGDIEALGKMRREDPAGVCGNALSSTDFARRRGMDGLDQRLRAHWLGIAGASLRANRSTFAVLPLSELLRPGGYLDALRAEGFEVEAPL